MLNNIFKFYNFHSFLLMSTEKNQEDVEHYQLCHTPFFLFFKVKVNVLAQWIRPRTLNREVPGSNLLAAAEAPLGKALYPHCLVPPKGHEAIGPLVACL